MSVDKKLMILRTVEGLGVPVTEALAKLEVSPSTDYRWRRRFRTEGRDALHDRKPCRGRNWNQLLPEERANVLHIALLYEEFCQMQNVLWYRLNRKRGR